MQKIKEAAGGAKEKAAEYAEKVKGQVTSTVERVRKFLKKKSL